MTRFAVVGVAAVVLAVVAACSDKEAGAPTGTPGVTTTTSEAPESPTSTRTSGSKPSGNAELADLEACDLPSGGVLQTLGADAVGKEVKTAGVSGCQWRVDKGSLADSYTLQVSIYPDKGIKDIQADSEIKATKVGEHEGAQSIRSKGASCAISVGVDESSRVDVLGIGSDGQKLCEPALALAKAVEPRLP